MLDSLWVKDGSKLQGTARIQQDIIGVFARMTPGADKFQSILFGMTVGHYDHSPDRSETKRSPFPEADSRVDSGFGTS